ncbi:hypothetical protein BH18ACT12_BH18ACT12_00710 [soil metagenome]
MLQDVDAENDVILVRLDLQPLQINHPVLVSPRPAPPLSLHHVSVDDVCG